MTGLLIWVGKHSRWWLAASCVMALALPSAASFLRPTLPFLVSLIIGLAFARVDLKTTVVRLLNAPHLGRLALLTALIMPCTTALMATVTWVFGLSSTTASMLLIYSAAPPIASASAFCLLLGFDAVLALEVTVLASLLAPFFAAALFSSADFAFESVSAGSLFLRLAGIIAAGIALGALLKRLLGEPWIADNRVALDGLAAITTGLFVFPLFDGFVATLIADVWASFAVLALALALNLGSNVVASALARPTTSPKAAGAIGLMWGNRNLALFLAAFPADPLLVHFVALYQFPMYLTPLVWSVARRRKGSFRNSHVP